MDRDWRWTIRGRRCIGKPPVPRSCSRGLKKSFFAGPRTPETLAGSALRAAHTHMRTSTQVPLRMWHSKKEIQRPDSYISTSEALPPPARLPLFQVPGPGIYIPRMGLVKTRTHHQQNALRAFCRQAHYVTLGT